MAPKKRLKSVNKRLSQVSEISAEEEIGKSPPHKKLSDKLGPRWGKEEIRRFYQAYRKYGKDWTKVSAAVHNRSVEMVESLYNMNRAYLSLPEGTASVVGLIAMMTDHYNNEGIFSVGESSHAPTISVKSQKRKREEQSDSVKRDILKSRSIDAGDGCLNLLKKRHLDVIKPHAVGKRTPRVPVSYLDKNNRENTVSPCRKGSKSQGYTKDEGVHVAALALTEALQGQGSPQVKTMSLTTLSKQSGASVREDPVDVKCVGRIDLTGKTMYGKKDGIEAVRNSHIDHGEEACNHLKRGPTVDVLKKNVDVGLPNAKSERRSRHDETQRRKRLFRDESFSLDALQTLADVSLADCIDSKSSFQSRDERITHVDDKSNRSEAPASSNRRDRVKNLKKEKRPNEFSGVENSTFKKLSIGRGSSEKINRVFEVDKQPYSRDKAMEGKNNSLFSKIPSSEAQVDFIWSKSVKTKPVAEEECSVPIKGKHTGKYSASNLWKSSKVSETLLHGSVKEGTGDLALPNSQVPVGSQCSLSTKQKSRRKLNLKKIWNLEDMKSSEHIAKYHLSKYPASMQDGACHLKHMQEKLPCSLSSPLLRRWCTFEWFYSAIDYPWFAVSEFVKYLEHVSKGYIPRLNRFERGVIRNSLGSPRRFSEQFLREEREKLEQHRESIRKHYTKTNGSITEGLTTDFAKPLSVGQRVVALHPKTREVYDGSILTFGYDRCRVRFDNPDLGVESVRDIDCMPIKQLEDMSKAQSPLDFLAEQDGVCYTAAQAKGVANHMVGAAYNEACSKADTQLRESDVQALSKANSTLDKKEALRIDLQRTNKEILENKEARERSLKDYESPKKHHAMVTPLLQPGPHSTYLGNFLPSGPKLPISFPTSFDKPLHSQELGRTLNDILQVSRSKAQTMVDATIQAMSVGKEEEGVLMKMPMALDSINNPQSIPDFRLPGLKSSERTNGNLDCHGRSHACTSESLLAGHSPDQILQNVASKNRLQIPLELITSCIATLLMIQACTERQYPPADVAKIIDIAVTSLRPRCPQNLSIYREIQTSMGRLKTQILALVPS